MSLTDNLIAYWKFDESSGDAADSSGNSKTLTNNNTVAYGTGKINNAADLEASSSEYFSISNGTYFDVTSGSINCWINRESTGTAQRIISTYTNTGEGGFTFNITATNKLQAFFGEGNQAVTGGTDLTTTGSFAYMVTFTWTTARKDIYINATSEGSNTNAETMTAGETTVSVGRDQKFAVDYFDGLIDEMGFWSRALTSTEVTQLYNSGAGLAYPFAGSGPSNLKSLNTNVKANIKSYNTNLIANIKSINTNA